MISNETYHLLFLVAQEGCEPHLTSHTAANIRDGNNRSVLISVVLQCLLYIGYPFSLNALRCVNDVIKNNNNWKGNLLSFCIYQ